jgi:hypothetical protein
MNKALRFVRLDFVTIKPYLGMKNMLFIYITPLIFLISGNANIAIGMFLMLSTVFITYPFWIGEKNNIDSLYPTLAIERGTVVMGRYLFALFSSFMAAGIGYLGSLIMLTVMNKEFNALILLAGTLAAFAFFSIIQSIQLVMYFKLGYSKAKIMTFLSYLIVIALVMVISAVGIDSIGQLSSFLDWLATNAILAVVFATLVWLGILFTSIRLSMVFYNKRNF